MVTFRNGLMKAKPVPTFHYIPEEAVNQHRWLASEAELPKSPSLDYSG